MTSPAILIENLSQGYGTTPVVVDLSLEVGRGEIFGFIGPNGAGKTTTIRTVATLMAPMRGRVEVCGLDVELEPERVRHKLGYMPDHAGVYERLTVLEYLHFFAHASGVDASRVTPAVLELVGLNALTDKLVATLSKGMRQRLQLGRVLLHDPEVLVLDEPASDLDPRARIEMRDLLLELRELGKTIFLSSHILSELSDVCTSVGIIEKGRLVVSGPVGEISANLGAAPATVQLPGTAQALAPLAPLAAPGTAKTGEGPDTPPAAPETNAPGDTAVATPHRDAPPQATSQTPAAAPEYTPAGVAVPVNTQRRLKLRLLQDARSIRPLLEACPPIKSIDSEHGNLVVARYVGDDRFVAELVRYLVSHGIGVVGVEPERNDLERIFMQVTTGEQT